MTTKTETYTLKVCIDDLDIELEHGIELKWDTSPEIPGSEIEPAEPSIPAETSLLSAEVDGYDAEFLLGDLEVLEERLHQDD